MSNQQKSAVYILVVGLAAIAAYVALLLLVSPAVAPVAFSVLALTAFTPWLYHDETADEREHHIARRAGLAGGAAAYLFVLAVCMGVWWANYTKEPPLVDVNILPVIAMGAAVSLMVVRSAAVLVLHRQDLDLGNS